MINLLPTDVRNQIMYARRNTKLLHWTIALACSIAVMGAIIAGGQMYMRRSINSYSKDIAAAREELKLKKLEETQTRLEGISSSLKLAVQVLSRQVLFSKLIQQIGATMPENTVLTGLQIEKVQGSLTLTAQATNLETATQVQVNLGDPKNNIFEKADIESLQCSSDAIKYPCRVQIKALFGKNKQYYFIQNTSGNSGTAQ
jgi:hypothetical protein